MKSLKKAVLSIALVSSLISPARAAIGSGFAAPIAVVAGVAAIGISGGVAYGGYKLIKKGGAGNIIAGVGLLLASAAGGFFGLILLEGEQSADFSEVSEQDAQGMNVSAQEVAIYNSEIEQVNAIAREIGEVLKEKGLNNVELARDLWIELGANLSPETMKVVIAVAQQGQ